MVEFDVVAALVAGFVATIVMTAMMQGAKAAGMTDMPPMPLVMGSMMSGDRTRALIIGSVLHVAVMGTVVFGLIYAVAFAVLDADAWWTGAILGLVHGVLVGAVFMPMMPAVHPRMEVDPPRGGGVTVAAGGGHGLSLAAPGMWGVRWGTMTPLGLVMGHVVFGAVLALTYQAVV